MGDFHSGYRVTALSIFNELGPEELDLVYSLNAVTDLTIELPVDDCDDPSEIYLDIDYQPLNDAMPKLESLKLSYSNCQRCPTNIHNLQNLQRLDIKGNIILEACRSSWRN